MCVSVCVCVHCVFTQVFTLGKWALWLSPAFSLKVDWTWTCTQTHINAHTPTHTGITGSHCHWQQSQRPDFIASLGSLVTDLAFGPGYFLVRDWITGQQLGFRWRLLYNDWVLAFVICHLNSKRRIPLYCCKYKHMLTHTCSHCTLGVSEQFVQFPRKLGPPKVCQLRGKKPGT